MLDLIPDCGSRRALRVLCLGAHCDDIEIGCGATLRLLQRERQRLAVDWVILSGTPARRKEASRAMTMLVGARHRGTLHFGAFDDGRFPADYAGIKDFF